MIMQYDNFDKEMKDYINMAINIYSTIQDKNIIQDIFRYGTQKKYEEYFFTKFDKMILSLFIAGFMIKGNLKDKLEFYDDIKLKQLLEFINLQEGEIKELSDNDYTQFYNKYFLVNLGCIIENNFKESYGYIIKKVTPEIVLCALKNTKILDHYGRTYLNLPSFRSHQIFEALEYSIFQVNKDIIKIEEQPKKTQNSLNNTAYITNETSSEAPNQQHKQIRELKISVPELKKIETDVKEKFIGQEKAVEELLYNIFNNLLIAEMKGNGNFGTQRAIIFLDGPTGTGKTAIVRELSQLIGLPFVATPVTNYSATGYVGGNITDILGELLQKAGGNLELAQKGIIVLDEFDKISHNGSQGNLEMKRSVQHQLLDFMGGGTYIINKSTTPLFKDEIKFDTSNLTFICLAALTNLRSIKTEQNRTIGFEQLIQQPDQQIYSITPQSLIEMGLERELVGRFNTYIHTDYYDISALKKILTQSSISPLIGLENWIKATGKSLKKEDGIIDLIAKQAYELNTGARSLQTIINNIRTFLLKKVLTGLDKTIYLDCDTVSSIAEQTTMRKGRG